MCDADTTVTGLVPTLGDEAGGTTVSVVGTGLTQPAWCLFGTFSQVSATFLTSTAVACLSPPSVAGTKLFVEVATSDQTTANYAEFTYHGTSCVVLLYISVSHWFRVCGVSVCSLHL